MSPGPDFRGADRERCVSYFTLLWWSKKALSPMAGRRKRPVRCSRKLRRSSAAVATSRGGHGSLRSGRAIQRRRWGRERRRRERNVGNGPVKVRKCTVGNTAAVGSLRYTHRSLTRVHAQTRAANQMQILTPKPASHRTMLPVKTGPRRTKYPKAYVITGTASKTMIAHLF